MRRVLCLSSLVLTVLLLAGCRPERTSVLYRVTGDSSAGRLGVRYLDASGARQDLLIFAPWEKTLSFPPDTQASLMVISEGPGAFGCEVYDGLTLLASDKSGPGKSNAVCGGKTQPDNSDIDLARQYMGEYLGRD